MAVCVWRFAFGGLLRAFCGRFAGVLRAFCGRFAGVLQAFCRRFAGGLRAACVWRFEGSLRPVCERFADIGGLRLAVRVWRFAGGLLTVLRTVCGRIAGGFADGLRLAVCRRFASGKQAVVGRFTVGGLRLRL